MTVVQIRALTLINICTTTKLSIKGGPCNLHCGRNIVDLWYCSPLQFKPFWSNMCPSWQLQVELPMVSVQSCSHPPFAVSHSLMSVMQQVIVVPWLLNGYCYCTSGGEAWGSTMSSLTRRWYKPYPLRSHGTAGLYQQHQLWGFC